MSTTLDEARMSSLADKIREQAAEAAKPKKSEKKVKSKKKK